MLQIRAVDAAFEIRRIPLDFVEIGSPYDVDLDIVATEEQLVALLSAGVAGWVEISTNGGSSWDPVPADIQSGFDLGSFTSGEKKRIRIRITVPGGTDLRTQVVDLNTGTGV